MKKTKYFFAQVKTINDAERTLDAIASTSELDRDKDIILPSAFAETLGSFKANPVILACHQHRLQTGSSPVIGSAIPESVKIDKTKLSFTMRFATTALGEEHWLLYRDKHQRAFSVGFIPIEWIDEKDEHHGYIRTYTKIELLEISAVPVPSNRAALAVAAGYFDRAGIDDGLAEQLKASQAETADQVKRQLDEFTLRIEDHLDEIKSLLIPDRDGLAEKLLGDSEPSDPAGQNNPGQLAGIAGTLEQISEKINS